MPKELTEIDHLLAKARVAIHFQIAQNTPEREILGLLEEALTKLNDKVDEYIRHDQRAIIDIR